ncbi:MAG: HEAT repeat domain-containing protein [Deltaproteobacteria bacterium]|nr:HEAT repeat domain-containing protein [Deltaproteobacteria bacterium]
MRSLLAIGALFVALIAEFLALIQLVLHPTMGLDHLFAILGLHVFASLTIGEGLKLRIPKNHPSGLGAWRIGFYLVFFLPMFGILLGVILTFRPPKVAMQLQDDFLSPMEYRKQQAEAELADEAALGHVSADVETVADALKDEDKAKRLGAVEALREMGDKQAVELLSQSLNNTIFEVRFHAVEALAGINQKFSKQIATATQAVERDPSPDNHLILANVYYDYASLEMEEESIQQHLYRNASSSYRQFLSQKSDPEAMMKASSCLDRLGERDEALAGYKNVLTADPNNFSANLGIARAQFGAGQFQQLRETCRRILDLTLDRPPERDIAEVLVMWAEGRPRATTN